MRYEIVERAPGEASLYVPFLTKERGPDESIVVYGKVTGPDLDLDDQMVDPEWARQALADWFRSAANIRQMHSPNLLPAGKGIELSEASDGFMLRSKVVEPVAARLVKEGVYTGYSIGVKKARVVRDAKAPNGRIVGGQIVEVSLVDRPALPSAVFTIAKRAPDDCIEFTEGGNMEGVADTTPLAPDVAKREFSDKERERLAKEGKAMPDGSYPIENEEDLRNAIHAIGRAKDPEAVKKHIIQRAKALGKMDLVPEDWKDGEGEKKDTAKSAQFLGYLHDLLCPAYDLGEVLLAHPDVTKGDLAPVFGPNARQLVYGLLREALEGDEGTGANALDLEALAHIYSRLCDFIASADGANGLEQEVVLAARAQLHKAFGKGFPDASLHPAPVPGPEQFRRPALAAGHQRPEAQGGSKAPKEGPEVTAASFAGGRPDGDGSLVVEKMAALHDSLMAVYECPLSTLQMPAQSEHTAADQQDVPKSAKADAPALQQEAMVAEVEKRARRAAEEAFSAEVASLRAEITALTQRIVQLEASPAPALAPFRGTLGDGRSVEKAASGAMSAEEQGYVAALRELAATAPEPATRQWASEQLIKAMGVQRQKE